MCRLIFRPICTKTKSKTKNHQDNVEIYDFITFAMLFNDMKKNPGNFVLDFITFTSIDQC